MEPTLSDGEDVHVHLTLANRVVVVGGGDPARVGMVGYAHEDDGRGSD